MPQKKSSKKSVVILTINCGSSSVKYSLFNWKNHEVMAEGIVERIGIKGSLIRHQVPHRREHVKHEVVPDHHEAIKEIIHTLLDKKVGVIQSLSVITAVGHRVVHGGEHFTKSVLVDGPEGKVVKTFRNLSTLAPLHNPNNILGIISAMDILPRIPHIAIMDTAFLHTMPKHTFLYAGPYEWYSKYGIRKYGFHGTSHLYVSRRVAALLGKKPSDVNLITCHIGNGVSFTAIKNGEAYEHSMGFTPLEGLIMGTRSGDIDPAIVSYISEMELVRSERVITILNKESGLKGITGEYVDRRDIFQASLEGNERCKLAIEMEVHRMKKYIGSYIAALGRIDAMAFTAGAGEKAWWLREKALDNMENLGIILDKELNRKAVSKNHEFLISKEASPIKIFVIPTNEELVMVEDVVAIVEGRYDIHTKFTYSFEDVNYVDNMREEAYKRELKIKKMKKG
ncbi:MAG: acetate kinase [Spirochaetes bacterium]|nr:acetate kinase [Spirochaetota bacterium]